MRIRTVAVIVSALFLGVACSNTRMIAVPTQHIVMVGTDGKLIDPTGSVRCEPNIVEDNEKFYQDGADGSRHEGWAKPPESYSWTPCNGRFVTYPMRALRDHDAEGYFADLFAEMDKYFDDRAHENHDSTRRIALVIHGGLNTDVGTIERARAVAGHMKADGIYPIFINWQSNLPRSLGAHLLTVRHGDNQGMKSAPLAPLYLVADIAEGFGHAPVLWVDQFENDADRSRRWLLNHHVSRAQSDFCEALLAKQDCRRKGCDAIDISKGPFLQEQSESNKSMLRYAATGAIPMHVYGSLFHHAWPVWTWLPLRYFLSPVLYGLGGPAWNEMERHAALGFHGPTEATSAPGEHNENVKGGIARFLDALADHIKSNANTAADCPNCGTYELTIIGHSMGAIVENHIVRDFGDRLPITNLVYMAAACSIRDFEDSVYPYLQRTKQRKVNVYSLMLDDFAEVRDQYAAFGPFEFAPSGSLLVWIDNYFTRPATLRDRTAGRFDNLMLFLGDIPEGVKSQVHIKIFGLGEKIAMTDPQHHGSFFDFDGEPHECIPSPQSAATACIAGKCAEIDKRSLNHRKPGCIYSGRFWASAFWLPEKTERRSDRLQCLLND